MTISNYMFTSESVSEGHPDKVSDQISDGILDALLKQDPQSRVAVETLVKTGLVVIAGEVTSRAVIDYGQIARKVIQEIGYNSSELGFDARSCGVLVAVEQQSEDIAAGVNVGEGLHQEQGAGDQGMMFGYACNETPELMPATIQFSHNLLKKLSDLRRKQEVAYLRPDAKSQVTCEYRNGKLARVDTVVISTQHDESVTHKELTDFIVNRVIKSVIPNELIDDKTKYHVNPTGRFVIGGPQGDCGLTGRKIIVDTYGGHGAHGGGAFSGKDPTKVDRSAAYMGRYVAKNVVAAGLADKCLVQLAYAIGVPHPVSVFVDTYNTGTQPEERIAEVIREVFDLTPGGIVKNLGLLKPMYQKTASYGHFGRSEFPWEKLDKVKDIKAQFS